MTVIDIGCASYQTLSSVQILTERFKPDLLLGFDPNAMVAGYCLGDTAVQISPLAVWWHDGEVAYDGAGYAGRVSEGEGCACRDIAGLVTEVEGELVIKIDAEGAEYPILRRLHESGRDANVTLLLVEWHEPDDGKDWLLENLRCPVEEWAH